MLLNHLIELKRYSHSGEGYSRPPRKKESDPDRGPHEGKELAMLLDGVKPAGIVSTGDYRGFFEQHVNAGKLISKKFMNRANFYEYVVALPGEEHRIDAIIKLLQAPASTVNDMYHARLGRLLGYTKEQVRKWLRNEFND